jgi:nucleotide-binding universal stress UspA family protein
MGLTDKVDDAVVVGVDGSASSLAALDWAADQAHLEGRALTLVHAATLGAVTTREVDSHSVSALLHAEGRAVLQQAHRRVARRQVGDVLSEVALDDPATLLVEASRHAALVVVGSHGRGPLASRLLGSVGVHLARHARCPVVVCRPGGWQGGGEDGVVVGMDGPGRPGPALEWAARLADLRQLPLTVVHAAPDRPDGTVPVDEPGHEVLRGQLHEAARGLRDRHPDLRVSLRLVGGRPDRALVHAAAGADVLVIGAHARTHLLRAGEHDVTSRTLERAPGVVAVVPGRD